MKLTSARWGKSGDCRGTSMGEPTEGYRHTGSVGDQILSAMNSTMPAGCFQRACNCAMSSLGSDVHRREVQTTDPLHTCKMNENTMHWLLRRSCMHCAYPLSTEHHLYSAACGRIHVLPSLFSAENQSSDRANRVAHTCIHTYPH